MAHRANAALLASLGLQPNRPSSPGYSAQKLKAHDSTHTGGSESKPAKRKREKAALVEGARKSARIRDQPAPPTDSSIIDQDDEDRTSAPARRRGPLIRKLEPVPLPEPADLEDYDPDYRAPPPVRDEQNTIRFEEGYEHFTPNLTPKEIFRVGRGLLCWMHHQDLILTFSASSISTSAACLVVGSGEKRGRMHCESRCTPRTRMPSLQTGGKASTRTIF